MNGEAPDFSQLPLRDLHLPDAISWWPLAPGWWMLLGLLIVLGLVVWLLMRFYRKRRLRRAAFAELKGIQAIYRDTNDSLEFVRRISVLLRRVALSFRSRKQVAGLSGEEWLEFLDQGVAGSEQHGGFTAGVGRVLIEAPYNPRAEVDVEGVSRLAKEWLGQVTRGKGAA